LSRNCAGLNNRVKKGPGPRQEKTVCCREPKGHEGASKWICRVGKPKRGNGMKKESEGAFGRERMTWLVE